MQVQQPNKIRKAVLIGAVGVALTGAGVAVVSAASGPQRHRRPQPRSPPRPAHPVRKRDTAPPAASSCTAKAL